MPGKLAALALAVAAVSASGTACAMKSSPTRPESVSCRVVGGEKLPARSGGARALCAAIEQAASGTGAEVEIRVLTPSRLAATVTTRTGERLPEQNFAISDATLTSSSFERFARAIAIQLAEAGGR